mmetsp:Transcript_35270/g.64843  ORF Transcript_35270/g.64843 Transcript_35270/m.64843 type:complete len:83 (+) Transcript_35270:767-1015(+)
MRFLRDLGSFRNARWDHNLGINSGRWGRRLDRPLDCNGGEGHGVDVADDGSGEYHDCSLLGILCAFASACSPVFSSAISFLL